MKIATFNANSVRSRMGIVLDWLKKQKPDVLCLQETKATDPDFPETAFTAAGYHVLFRGEKSYNGVATLSREKPASAEFGFDDGGPVDETRLLTATIGGVHVVNTYVPQGRSIDHPMYRYKLEWFRRLRDYFNRRFSPRSNVVWVGDLNVAPEAMDIYNAGEQQDHVCYHEAVRKAFAETVAWGFVDVFRIHHPEAGQYSYFDYRNMRAVENRHGWRVDHILATRPMAEKSVDAWIDLKPRLMPKPSDHTFVAAEFSVARALG